MTRSRAMALNLTCLALLALIAVGTGHLILITALGTPDTLARAEALKGM